jgi:hypothetical protein
MFGLDWNDPQTFWLNLTNLGLGLITLACLAFIVVAVMRELASTAREKAGAADPLLDTHAFRVPELGITMADGGEPLKKREPERKPERRRK